jgi:membrane fusion protein, multidrug efflux system
MDDSFRPQLRQRSARFRTFATLSLFATVLATAAIVSGCEKPAPPKANNNPRVIVTKPIMDSVIDYQDFTGRLDAYKTVEIKPRVTGYITDAPFKEGDPVEKGSLLFQVDKRPYEADLNQAKANLNVAIADRNFQEKNVERYGKVIKSVSREEYETAVAALEKAIANVAAMEAALARAKLYLEYTNVTAPLSGRISRRLVDPGNLVTADSTALTTIVAESPMYAYFDVDERTYLDLLAQEGKTAWTEGLKLPVLMRLANEDEFATVGFVDFVDNRVVATTGTVRMRGVFENSKERLKAGLFVRIRLPISASYRAVLIPDEAIQSDQERKYVWVVNAKDEVEYRPVELGQSLQKLRVVKPAAKGKEGKEGLSEEDRVIISGMQRARNGLKVDVETQAPPVPPEVPLVRVLNVNKAKN